MKIVKGKMQESISVLKELFGKVPIISDIRILDQSEYGFTVILKEQGDENVDIRVICLDRAVPSSVKKALEQPDGQTYRIIMAPYISDASAKICEASGAGYCDLSGNCRILLDNIYISEKGNPNRYPVENHAKTIFKTSRTDEGCVKRMEDKGTGGKNRLQHRNGFKGKDISV